MRNILRTLIALQINDVKLLLHGEMLDEEDVGGRGKLSSGEDAYPWGTGDAVISGRRACALALGAFGSMFRMIFLSN